ncbi:MAG: hypothetical protein WD651_12920 [Acidimicrobiia bacterium]
MAARSLVRVLVVVAGAAIWLIFAFRIGDDHQLPSTNPTTRTSAQATTTTEESCSVSPPPAAPVLAGDPDSLSLAVSRAAFECAPVIVIGSATDFGSLQIGIQLAAAAQGPLLLTLDDVVIESEATRLEVEEIFLLVEADLSTTKKLTFLTMEEAIDATRRLNRDAEPLTNDEGWGWSRAVISALTGAEVVTGGVGVFDLGIDTAAVATSAPDSDVVWLADGTNPALAAPVVAAAAARGESALLVDPTDLRRLPVVVDAVRRIAPAVAIAAGPYDSQAVSWQTPALVAAPELPGGGLIMFPGRRLVAYYGNPSTPNLGILGAQNADETINKLIPIATEYSADGVLTVPTFEIIATVASANAGSDDDYSEETPLDVLRPWIEIAGERGVYVVLDLQPGRTDYLTQAQRYEEFLRLPHVGLALDPEWRLQPNQVHLRQVGTVDAVEINTVVDWLSAVVRESNLPQKLLLLHQFKLSMITNRELIETPPELAVVIQMDGQGPLPSKYGTYSALTAGAEDADWMWGWKNFYQLDTPLATAAEVLDLEPLPVFVSFQ